jgi:hypothetical protein
MGSLMGGTKFEFDYIIYMFPEERGTLSAFISNAAEMLSARLISWGWAQRRSFMKIIAYLSAA